MDGLWQAVKVIAVTVLVVAAAGWTARQTAARMRSAGRGRHLAIVDSISLGLQRGLFLVRLGERYVVIGLARDNITLLSDLGPAALGSPGGQTWPAPGREEGRDSRGGPGGFAPAAGDPAAARLASRLDALWAKLSGDGQREQDHPARRAPGS